MSIQISIKRSGFPVRIGEVELWFDTSVESLSRFLEADKEIERRFNEYQKEIVERSNNGEFDDIKDGVFNKRVADEALNLELKRTEISYDVLFGDGTFTKVYEVYPDYQALNSAFEEADALITAELEKLNAERQKEAERRSGNYVAKAKKKRRKKK